MDFDSVRISEIIGWVVTVAYLYFFSRKYFNDVSYQLIDRPDHINNGSNLEIIRIVPVYPRWLVSWWTYNGWFFLFFFYVLTLYFLIQMVLDLASTEELEAAAATSPWLVAFPQLTAAFVISGVLAPFPAIDKPLSIARSITHQNASIPTLAMTLANDLTSRRIDLRSDQQAIAKAEAEGSLVEGDMNAPKNAPQYKWLMICFMVGWLKSQARPESAYATALTDAGIGFRLADQIFQKLKAELSARPIEERFNDGRINDDIDILFERLIQIIVCIVLSSEANYSRAKAVLQEQGMASKFLKDYQPELFVWIIGAGVVFGVSFILAILARIVWPESDASCPGTEASNHAQYALGVAIGVVLMLVLPAISILMVKAALLRHWPVRLPGQNRLKFIYPIVLIFGLLQGFVWLFVLGYYELINFETCNPDWYTDRMPYAVLPAILCFLTAWLLDRVPTTTSVKSLCLRAASPTIVTVLFFLLIGFIIAAVDGGIVFPEGDAGFWSVVRSTTIADKAARTLILVTSGGLVVTALLSVVCDLACGFDKKRDEAQMYITEFILPYLKSKDVNFTEITRDRRLDLSKYADVRIIEALNKSRILQDDGRIYPEYLDDIQTFRRQEMGLSL
ncbi:hypothetical protein [Thalassobaculum salexigens]|uniref:hypothetical protein n=1 Tax=Thalassobaculum salexigens TaxID=455360 RepID=UPI00248F2A12|nr:hypothetical protein [Thalassobaculum salexigens]